MNNFWKLGIGAVIAWLVLKPRTLWTTKQLTLVDLNEKGNTAGAFPTDTIYKPGDKLGTVAKGKPITLEGYNIIFIKSAKSPNIWHAVDVDDIKQFTSTHRVSGIK